MNLGVLGLLLLLVVIAGFTASNLSPITLMFWRWPLIVAPLSLIVVGAAVLGAIVVMFISWPGPRHLRARIRDLEGRLRVLEVQPREVQPREAPPAAGQDDTRRFPS